MTITFDCMGKPNSSVRPRIAAPSADLRLMPVQAKPGVVAEAKAAISAAVKILRIMGRSSFWKLRGRFRCGLSRGNRESRIKHRAAIAGLLKLALPRSLRFAANVASVDAPPSQWGQVDLSADDGRRRPAPLLNRRKRPIGAEVQGE